MPVAEWKGIDARHPSFHQPHLICVDPSNNVFILDQLQYRILQFSPDGTFQKAWELPGDEWVPMWRAIAAADSFLYASTSSGTYQFFPDGSVAHWNFGTCVNGLAVDPDGNLIVSVSRRAGWSSDGRLGTDRERTPPPIRQRLDILPKEEQEGIWMLTSQGEILKHWKTPGWPIAMGKEGAIYAVEPDSGADFVRIHGEKIEFRECGLKLTSVGLLRGIAVSEQGNIFVNDRHNVVEMDPRGRVVRRWCELGPSFDPIGEPRSLAVDGQDNLYLIDGFKTRILKFRLGGS